MKKTTQKTSGGERRAGRPRKHDRPINVSAYLPYEDAKTLQEAADRRTGGNLSAYLREIAAYLREEKTITTKNTATEQWPW